MCLQNKGQLIQCEAINLVNGRSKLNPSPPWKRRSIIVSSWYRVAFLREVSLFSYSLEYPLEGQGDLFCSSNCPFNFFFSFLFSMWPVQREVNWGSLSVGRVFGSPRRNWMELWERKGLVSCSCPGVEELFPWICLVSSCFWRHRTLGSRSECGSVTVILRMWSPDQLHQHHQRTSKKCKFLGLIPDVLNQKLCGWSPAGHVLTSLQDDAKAG